MMFFCMTLLMSSAFVKTTSDLLKVVGPAAPLVAEAGEDLVLPCFIQPSISANDMRVEWFRLHLTDTLVHLYEYYEDRNEKQMESYKGRTGLFKEELQNGNASLKLSAVRPSDEGAYKCYIESKSWYDDITVYVEVKGKVFHAWKIAILCISVFSVILTAFIGCILKEKFSEKKLSPIQCSAIAYMRLKSQHVRNEWDLKKFNTSEEGYRRLIPSVRNCSKARLADCNLTVQNIETLGAALQSENTALKHLDLSNNNLWDSGLELLSSGLKSSHSKLEILRLATCKLGKQSCDTLQAVLQSENLSLKEMDLCNNVLQDSGVELLSVGLKSSHCKLEILRLASCNLTKGSCKFLTSALQSENTFLKELDISNNNLRSSGVEQLSVGLKSAHCKLEILKLAICNLTVESCKYLTSALNLESFSLKELDLSNNDLQDSGVEVLSTGLKSSDCKLRILRLSGCLVTKQGCSFLASALSSNPSHLKELDLTYNHPEDSGVKLLFARQQDPDCKLETLKLEHGRSSLIKLGLRKYACELTLDPNTANIRLSLSEGGRAVKRVTEQQPYPVHPERFDSWKEVLCRESLTGRCYWEAEYSGSAAVALTYKAISRKGDSDDCRFGYNGKSWGLDCRNDSYTAWHNKKYTAISMPFSSNRVGVYLDWPAGTLSFYSISSDTHTLTHLHTFNYTFIEPLFAGFWVDIGSSVCVCEMEEPIVS
ncbi:uncharacterized protein [Salminus brasiliensis]|uniref:uncharacterized protein n=1 Tax=Salminus brasiliensis TaxID=930266 RepID=UPI003B831308